VLGPGFSNNFGGGVVFDVSGPTCTAAAVSRQGEGVVNIFLSLLN